MLTEDALQRLVSASESRTLEKKKSCPNASELRKSMVALANGIYDDEYAVLLLGVSDDGKAVGLEGLDSMQKTIWQCINDCYPPIPAEIQSFTFGEKELLAVVIRDAKQKPYFTGKSYVRVGSVSTEASGSSFDELIAQRTDLVRRILQQKGKKVSATFPKGDAPRWTSASLDPNAPPNPNGRDYIVVHCDNWVLKLKDAATDKQIAFALKEVSVNWDARKDRIRLDISIPHPGTAGHSGIIRSL